VGDARSAVLAALDLGILLSETMFEGSLDTIALATYDTNRDIYCDDPECKSGGTSEFRRAVIESLGVATRFGHEDCRNKLCFGRDSTSIPLK
jgi:hypothetical protein